MERIFEQMTSWIKGWIVDALMVLLEGMFDNINSRVGQVASDVATSPANFTPGVFNLMREVSNNAVMPIAGMILTFIACYELIQLVIAHNNLANFETWIFFKWIFKTFVAVMLITNCFDITMAIFDVAGHVITGSGAIIQNSTAVDGSGLAQLRTTLEGMSIGGLLPLFGEIFLLSIGIKIMSMMIFLVIYGRMIEIYLMLSLAPLPFSTFGNREQSQIGQNYVKSLVALGFQGFLIVICVAIYAVLIQNVTISSDIRGSLWGILGYNILLVFALFKTGTLSKRIFSAQ
ncbi:VirB6/TrbL-like conjugal transfer protein, CD1112 family [Butyrivibrio sp. AE2005]|uniref:VirB6/TrbL-like conjugal transfer protein, CD1112 family n=1 Tax=Butyrivibrio sp. AE2005 TaxID=1496722 RepID=UPI00047D93BC|nr:CD0415/CD1112 family protein [Butyrivibrio sp. AE2005]